MIGVVVGVWESIIPPGRASSPVGGGRGAGGNIATASSTAPNRCAPLNARGRRGQRWEADLGSPARRQQRHERWLEVRGCRAVRGDLLK